MQTVTFLPVDNSSKFEFVKQKIKMNGLKWSDLLVGMGSGLAGYTILCMLNANVPTLSFVNS